MREVQFNENGVEALKKCSSDILGYVDELTRVTGTLQTRYDIIEPGFPEDARAIRHLIDEVGEVVRHNQQYLLDISDQFLRFSDELKRLIEESV